MTRSRWPLVVAVALGIGLALAPVAFRMFDRAPRGGEMIDGFAPHMTSAEMASFRAHLGDIGAAHREVATLAAGTGADVVARHRGLARFEEEWPAIFADMDSMLNTMEANLDRFDGVAALPPFALFPWFFVVPGLAVAAVAGWGRWSPRGRAARWPARAVAVLGVGLIAAPAVFGMFTRAPGGAAMIEDFEPYMATGEVVEMQGYFLVIGAAEGELRTSVLPELAGSEPAAADLDAATTLTERWPAISADMAPMIGAMADHVDSYAAVAALPPFWLFPWFFVIPGVILLGLAVAARHRPPPDRDRSGDPDRHLQGASA